MASKVFKTGKLGIMNGTIDLDNDTLKIALAGSNYDPSSDEPATLSVLNSTGMAALETANGYTSYTRQTAGSVTVALSGTDVICDGTATFATLGAGNHAVRWVIIYKHITDDTDAIPICACQYPADITPNGSDLDIAFNSATGFLKA